MADFGNRDDPDNELKSGKQKNGVFISILLIVCWTTLSKTL